MFPGMPLESRFGVSCIFIFEGVHIQVGENLLIPFKVGNICLLEKQILEIIIFNDKQYVYWNTTIPRGIA